MLINGWLINPYCKEFFIVPLPHQLQNTWPSDSTTSLVTQPQPLRAVTEPKTGNAAQKHPGLKQHIKQVVEDAGPICPAGETEEKGDSHMSLSIHRSIL